MLMPIVCLLELRYSLKSKIKSSSSTEMIRTGPTVPDEIDPVRKHKLVPAGSLTHHRYLHDNYPLLSYLIVLKFYFSKPDAHV